jgi:phosphate transport system substrate-binding protein
MVSRDLKDDEADKLDETIIAWDGIIVIVNKDNPVQDLSLDEVKKIFTGEITNWKDVGGEDKEIAVVSREEGSGTRDGFESVVGFETTELISNSDIQNATGSVISDVSGNTHAIGYISLGSNSNQVKAVSIESVEANEDTIKDGSYKLRRPFTLCVKKGNEEAEALFDFIFSDEGKTIIQEQKYIPVERAE